MNKKRVASYVVALMGSFTSACFSADENSTGKIEYYPGSHKLWVETGYPKNHPCAFISRGMFRVFEDEQTFTAVNFTSENETVKAQYHSNFDRSSLTVAEIIRKRSLRDDEKSRYLDHRGWVIKDGFSINDYLRLTSRERNLKDSVWKGNCSFAYVNNSLKVKQVYGDFNGDKISDVFFLIKGNSKNSFSVPRVALGVKDIKFLTVKGYWEEKPLYGNYAGQLRRINTVPTLHYDLLGKLYSGILWSEQEINTATSLFETYRFNYYPIKVLYYLFSHDIDFEKAKISAIDRNKDGRDDLVIKQAGKPDLISFAEPDGTFLKAEVDTGLGKYKGPSRHQSRFCNRELLTHHPEQNPSSIHYDDICRTAYVTPPQTGSTTLEQLIPAENTASVCPVLVNTVKAKQQVVSQLGDLTARYKTIVGSLDEAQSLRALVAAKTAAYQALQSAYTEEYKAHTAWLKAKREYAQLDYQWEICLALANNASGSCPNEQQLLTTQQTKLNQLATALDQAVTVRREKQATYDEAINAYEAQLVALVELDQQLNKVLSQYYELANKELAVFKEYAKLDGATAKVRYNLDWQNQLQQYQALNNKLDVTFKPMPLSDVKVIATLPRQQRETPIGDVDISLPNVLYTQVNDSNLLGYESALMPNGEGTINQTVQRYPSETVNAPEHINSTIGLSMSGYCLSYAPNSPYPQVAQKLAAHVAPSLSYEFEEEVRRGYVAKYNLYKFIQTIVQTKKKKRWFKKKKKTYIIRRVITKDWFNIQFDSSTPEYTFSIAEQDAITQQVKANLIHRANNQIGVMYGYASKHCQFKENEDCLAGYWLGQPDGPDGDTKAIAHFKAGNNQWVAEKVFGIRYLKQQRWMQFAE
ncbi:hypothetical protein [Zooshikella ganghwensis]|uniref:Uncharacterized protein n=1 Tax=Zooshikella ganghwensis TaxID=202772 RepID=A0A4V1INT5_9GAMM|nr:hypothetical protein [Zooshikella ganghwensis]RDH44851.1 hypothetical protein B9G39_16200 [Zooshikella ganghwensis]